MKNTLKRLIVVFIALAMFVVTLIPIAAATYKCPGNSRTHTPDNCDYSITKEVRKPNCTTSGYYEAKCKQCNKTFEYSTHVEHDYGAWQKNNDATHKRTCRRSDCRLTETLIHQFTETTDSSGKKISTCTDCGYSKASTGSTSSSGNTGNNSGSNTGNSGNTGSSGGTTPTTPECSHVWGKAIVVKSPTHANSGISKAICSKCQNERAWITSNQTDHTFENWTPVDDDFHNRKCDCGKVEKEAHQWNQGKITTAPTTEAEGMKTYRCLGCDALMFEVLGKIVETENETEKPETKAPETEPKKEPVKEEPSKNEGEDDSFRERIINSAKIITTVTVAMGVANTLGCLGSVSAVGVTLIMMLGTCAVFIFKKK